MTQYGEGSTRLKDYALAKQGVTTSVRAVKHLLDRHNTPGSTASVDVEQAQSLLVKLAEDRFNLVVLGQFKRGKSSLMNAVIGRNLLPTGLLPLTSAITTSRYGPRERILLRRKGWSLEQEIPFTELADYVTEQGNPGNQKQLIEARVEVPVRFLRRGLHFIDTPGIGSTRQENTATTYAILPEADAVIFVTSVEAPFSEIEQAFLRDIRGHARKLFMVVNKADLLGGTEREAVLNYIRSGIEETLGSGAVRLYPVSAREALDAKLGADPNGLRASGLGELEEALATFLSREQGRTFLVSILDRALGLLADFDSNASIPAIPEPGLAGAELTAASLRERMESQRVALLSDSAEVDTGDTRLSPVRAANTANAVNMASTQNRPGSADVSVIEQAIATSQSEQPRRHRRGATCPVCSAQGEILFSFFANWQYLLATSESAQHEFAASRGLCPVHTWQFQQIASPQGISDGYRPLLESVIADLRQLAEGAANRPAERVGALLSRTETCPACRVVRESATREIGQLLVRLTTTEGEELYSASEGLCLPHLRLALALSSYPELDRFLLHQQLQHLEEISEDMHGYALKREALRRGLLNTQEENAWRRALVQMVGEQTLVAIDT